MFHNINIKFKVILCLTIVVIYGCSHKNDSQSNNSDSIASNEQVKQQEENNEKLTGNSDYLYIDLLKKFYNHPTYFLTLYYKGDYSELASEELIKSKKAITFEDSDIKRTAIDDSVANKNLMTQGLQKLLVFGDNQEVIDTIHLSRFEHYENMIETSFIATYQTDLPTEQHVVISADKITQEEVAKISLFPVDSSASFEILSYNHYKPNIIYSFQQLLHQEDTLSFLSFADSQSHKECIYLLKNNIPQDSVINDFIITSLHPVPISFENEILFVAEVAIPETDAMWTSLIGIDLSTLKLIFYSRNRKIL